MAHVMLAQRDRHSSRLSKKQEKQSPLGGAADDTDVSRFRQNLFYDKTVRHERQKTLGHGATAPSDPGESARFSLVAPKVRESPLLGILLRHQHIIGLTRAEAKPALQGNKTHNR